MFLVFLAIFRSAAIVWSGGFLCSCIQICIFLGWYLWGLWSWFGYASIFECSLLRACLLSPVKGPPPSLRSVRNRSPDPGGGGGRLRRDPIVPRRGPADLWMWSWRCSMHPLCSTSRSCSAPDRPVSHPILAVFYQLAVCFFMCWLSKLTVWFPTCHVRVVRFYQSWIPPPLLSSPLLSPLGRGVLQFNLASSRLNVMICWKNRFCVMTWLCALCHSSHGVHIVRLRPQRYKQFAVFQAMELDAQLFLELCVCVAPLSANMWPEVPEGQRLSVFRRIAAGWLPPLDAGHRKIGGAVFHLQVFFCELRFCQGNLSLGLGSGWVGTNAWCNMESCYLKKFFFDMATLKALAFAIPTTRHWYDVGAETGWDEKDVVDRSLGKFWIYSLKFPLNTCWALLFSSLVPFLIFNIPQRHWV